jgi:hypothetical protein
MQKIALGTCFLIAFTPYLGGLLGKLPLPVQGLPRPVNASAVCVVINLNIPLRHGGVIYRVKPKYLWMWTAMAM